jgi:hypothetical protein
MWALSKIKDTITVDDTYFRLMDNVGFDQIMVGDIIVMDRVRLPEYMLVTGFDESNKLIQVQRGYHGTNPSAWTKGNPLRIFRIMNGIGESELVYEDQTNVDGSTDNTLSESYLVYRFGAEDTCLPGCYWLEFKVLKMADVTYFLPGGNWTGETHQYTDGFFYTGTSHTDSSVILSLDQVNDRKLIGGTVWSGEVHEYSSNYYTGSAHDDGSVILNVTGIPSTADIDYNEDSMALMSFSGIPSFTDPSLIPADFGCTLGTGVEWVRRFPVDSEGFLIKVIDSPTQEL